MGRMVKGVSREPDSDYPDRFVYPHRLHIQRPPSASRFFRARSHAVENLEKSPAVGRANRIFEPGFPGGILAVASGFLFKNRHAHHNRCWVPCFECWLKTSLFVTHRAGDSPSARLLDQWP